MTRSNDEATGSFALAHEQRDGGGGAGFIGEPDGSAGGADGIRDSRCDAVGSEPVVIADQHAFAGIFAAHDVARDRVRDDTRVCEGKILRYNAAPAIRAEANGSHRD